MKYKVSFIGSGNVAWHLSHALDAAGHTIEQVISKTEENAAELAKKFGSYFSDDISKIDTSVDACICCVSDDQLKTVVHSIPKSRMIILHTCGSQSMDILEPASPNFGVFYPLQSFSKGKAIDMLNVPFLLEASNNQTNDVVHALADSISNNIRQANSTQRLQYHLSAVFANNFVNRLYHEADRYLQENDLDFSVLIPIIQETAAKIKTLSPKDAQTGPAKRGDIQTIEKHLKLLADHKDLQQLYVNFTNAIQDEN